MFEGVAGRSLAAVWTLTGSVAVFVPLWGYMHDEFLGYLSFTMLLCGILINVSNVLVMMTRSGGERISKGAWTVLAIGVLGIATWRLNETGASDVSVFLVWAMMMLSFPVGLFVALLLGLAAFYLHNAFSIVIPENHYILFFTWASFFAIGYFQWFKFVPSVADKILSRRILPKNT